MQSLVVLALLVSPLHAKQTVMDQVRSLDEQSEQLRRTSKKILAALKKDVEIHLIRKEKQMNDRLGDWRDGWTDLNGAAFKRDLDEALDMASANGLDRARMEKLFALMKKGILQADLVVPSDKKDIPELIGDSLASFFEPAAAQEARMAEEEAQRTEFRTQLFKRSTLAFFEAMIEPDSKMALAKFKNLQGILQKFKGADAMALQAEADFVVAQQTLVNDVVTSLPVAGEIFDTLALIRGEDLAGIQLGHLEKGITALTLMPGVGDLIAVLRRSPGMSPVLGKLAKGLDKAAHNPKLMDALARVWKSTPDQLNALSKKLNKLPGARATKSAREVDNLFKQSKLAAAEAPGSDEAVKIWEGFHREGRGKAKRLNKDLTQSIKKGSPPPLSPKNLESYVNCRQSKACLSEVKKYKTSVRGKITDLEDQLYGTVTPLKNKAGKDVLDAQGKNVLINKGDGLVDKRTIKLMKSKLSKSIKGTKKAKTLADDAVGVIEKQLKQKAMKSGKLKPGQKFKLSDHLDVEDMEIRVFNASNNPPARGAVGMDRDITYQLVLKDGSSIDVPKKFAEPNYNESLYKTLKPGNKLPAEDELIKFGMAMDHAVTDAMDKEAYRLLKGTLDDVINPKKAAKLNLADAAAVSDTMVFKGMHWFKGAEKVAGRKSGESLKEMISRVGPEKSAAYMEQMAEGYRQMSKQYKNIIEPRFVREGLNPKIAVSPKVQEIVRLFNLANKHPKGMTPLQVEAALKKMHLTPSMAARELADLLPLIEGLTPKSAKMRGGSIVKTLRKSVDAAKPVLRRVGGKSGKKAAREEDQKP